MGLTFRLAASARAAMLGGSRVCLCVGGGGLTQSIITIISEDSEVLNTEVQFATTTAHVTSTLLHLPPPPPCSIYPTGDSIVYAVVLLTQPGATPPLHQQFASRSNREHLPHVERRYRPLVSSRAVI